MAKPLQVRAIADMLESDEYDTPTEMAKAILNRYDELRSEDVEWAIVTEYDNGLYLGVRGFATRAQSLKFFEAGKVGIPGMGRKAIVPFYHRSHVDKTFRATDTFESRHDGHWALIREKAGVA